MDASISRSSTTHAAPPPRPHGSTPGVPLQGFEAPVQRPKRRWLLIAVGLACFLVAAAGVSSLARLLLNYKRDATILAGSLHEQMRRKDWDGIYRESSSEYQDRVTADKNRGLFEAIDRKLGSPVSTKQANISFNSNNGESYLSAEFQTTFSLNATGTESLQWTKGPIGPYRLVSYRIDSTDLIER